jgi:hypothetical protein
MSISIDFPQNGIKTSGLNVLFNFFVPPFLIEFPKSFPENA